MYIYREIYIERYRYRYRYRYRSIFIYGYKHVVGEESGRQPPELAALATKG